MRHTEKSPLAGLSVKLRPDFKHLQYPDMDHIIIEDWWDHLTGGSWMHANGNPACLIYAMRTGLCDYPVPSDDEVLYGKYNGMGVLVHTSEIEGYQEYLKEQEEAQAGDSSQ